MSQPITLTDDQSETTRTDSISDHLLLSRKCLRRLSASSSDKLPRDDSCLHQHTITTVQCTAEAPLKQMTIEASSKEQIND